MYLEKRGEITSFSFIKGLHKFVFQIMTKPFVILSLLPEKDYS